MRTVAAAAFSGSKKKGMNTDDHSEKVKVGLNAGLFVER